MLKFNTDEFLAHFFKRDERVEVNADELQRLIRESRSKDAEIKRLCKTIADMKISISIKDERIKTMAMKRSAAAYHLDLSA